MSPEAECLYTLISLLIGDNAHALDSISRPFAADDSGSDPAGSPPLAKPNLHDCGFFLVVGLF